MQALIASQNSTISGLVQALEDARARYSLHVPSQADNGATELNTRDARVDAVTISLQKCAADIKKLANSMGKSIDAGLDRRLCWCRLLPVASLVLALSP